MGCSCMMVNIDGEALRRMLLDKGYTMADASRAIGYSDGYLKQSCQKNVIRGSAVELISAKLGIPRSGYEVVAVPEPEPQSAPPKDAEAVARAVVDYAVEQLRILLCECGVLGLRMEKKDDAP